MNVITIIQLLCSLGLPSFCVWFIKREQKKLEEQKKEQEAIKLGLVAILRYQMNELYKEYKANGTATVEEKEIFEALYKEYHALGGNGVMTSIYNYVIGL